MTDDKLSKEGPRKTVRGITDEAWERVSKAAHEAHEPLAKWIIRASDAEWAKMHAKDLDLPPAVGLTEVPPASATVTRLWPASGVPVPMEVEPIGDHIAVLDEVSRYVGEGYPDDVRAMASAVMVSRLGKLRIAGVRRVSQGPKKGTNPPPDFKKLADNG